jgi:hypothetical protein
MLAAERAPPRRECWTARSLSWYRLIRLAVSADNSACSPNSAFRCLAIRWSSRRDRFRALALKYLSNASASVIEAAEAGAGVTGFFVSSLNTSSASVASARVRKTRRVRFFTPSRSTTMLNS